MTVADVCKLLIGFVFLFGGMGILLLRSSNPVDKFPGWMIGITLSWVAALLVVIVAIVWGGYVYDKAGCKRVAKAAGIEYKFPNYMVGCMVKPNGKWIPLDKWRSIDGN